MITVFSDFDGVLFDTIKETFILCRAAIYGTDVFQGIDEKILKSFKDFKSLAYNSWQFLYLTKAINIADNDDVIEKTYVKLLQNRNLEEEKLFDEKYFKHRNFLLQNYPEFVDSLETPFPFYYELVENLDKYKVIIISKTNKSEIIRKLPKNSPVEVVAKEELGTSNKSIYISKYMKENKIKKAFFVDDNSNNLLPCKDINGLKCFLADWGNIAKNEKGSSLKEIIEEINR